MSAYRSALTGASISQAGAGIPERVARQKQAETMAESARLQVEAQKRQLEDYDKNAGVRDSQREQEIAQFKAQAYTANAQLSKQMTFDAFQRYEQDGDPRHLNNWLSAMSSNPVGQAVAGPMVRLDRIANTAEAKKMFQQQGISDFDGVLADPTVSKNFVIGTMQDGSQHLVDMGIIYGMSGYTKFAAEEQLQKIGQTAGIVAALRKGANLKNLRRDSELVKSVAQSTGIPANEIHSMLRQEDDSGSLGNTILGKATEMLMKQNPGMDVRSALSEINSVLTAEKHTTDQQSFIDSYMKENPESTSEDALAAYRSAGIEPKTDQQRFINAFMKDNPEATAEAALTAYRSAGADTKTDQRNFISNYIKDHPESSREDALAAYRSAGAKEPTSVLERVASTVENEVPGLTKRAALVRASEILHPKAEKAKTDQQNFIESYQREHQNATPEEALAAYRSAGAANSVVERIASRLQKEIIGLSTEDALARAQSIVHPQAEKAQTDQQRFLEAYRKDNPKATTEQALKAYKSAGNKESSSALERVAASLRKEVPGLGKRAALVMASDIVNPKSEKSKTDQQSFINSYMEEHPGSSREDALSVYRSAGAQAKAAVSPDKTPSSVIERVAATLREEDPNLGKQEALTKATELLHPRREEAGTDQKRFIDEYIQKNPGAGSQEALSVYRTIGKDVRTAGIKNSEYSEEAHSELDRAFGGDFLTADIQNLDSGQTRLLNKYLNRMEQVGGLKLTPEDKRNARAISKLINVAKDASNITDEQTGFIDATIRNVKSYINNSGIEGRKATNAYNNIKLLVQNALFGRQVSGADRFAVDSIISNLGQQTAPVLQSLQGQLGIMRDDLQATVDLNDPYVAKARFGASIDKIDSIIRSIDNRLDLIQRGMDKGQGTATSTRVNSAPTRSGKPSLNDIFGGK